MPLRSRMVLGIDPGQTGALAWVNLDGTLYEVEDMPVVGGEVNANLMAKLILGYGTLECAVVEKVNAMPPKGNRRPGTQSSFKFGESFGIIKGVLGALEIPTFYITPAAWKVKMHLSSDKEKSRKAALDRWPTHSDLFKFKKNENRAEAALLAVSWIQSPERVAWVAEKQAAERPLSKRRLIPRTALSDSATVGRS